MTIMVSSSNGHYRPHLNFSLEQSKVKKGLGVKGKVGINKSSVPFNLGTNGSTRLLKYSSSHSELITISLHLTWAV